ncbi:MAG: hypothetical protein V4582_24950 [Pseudomonadota bacterium]
MRRHQHVFAISTARNLRSVNAEIESLLREGLARRGVKQKEALDKNADTDNQA